MPLSWNLGTLTSWNPLGHSRPVTGRPLLCPISELNTYPHLHLFVLAQSTCTGYATFRLPVFHFPAETKDFLRNVKTDSGVHPAYFPFNWYRISYPAIKRARRDFHHLPPSGDEVKSECSYTSLPSLHSSPALRGFVHRGFVNSQGRSKIKISHSSPSEDRNIGIVRQIHQVFEPNRVMFAEWKGRKKVAPITTFLQRKEKH